MHTTPAKVFPRVTGSRLFIIISVTVTCADKGVCALPMRGAHGKGAHPTMAQMAGCEQGTQHRHGALPVCLFSTEHTLQSQKTGVTELALKLSRHLVRCSRLLKPSAPSQPLTLAPSMIPREMKNMFATEFSCGVQVIPMKW